MILFHGTDYNNLSSILSRGLKKHWEGIYLTDSKESAFRWVAFKLKAMGLKDVLVVEVDVDENLCQPGMDHSPFIEKIFGCGKSILYTDNISTKNILNYYHYKIE